LTREFLRAGALDEIILGIVPVLIGGGRPTFPPEFPETEVELVEVKQYKGGVMGLTYRVLNAESKRPAKRAARSRRRAKR
jgi:dihydrofolate reductase